MEEDEYYSMWGVDEVVAGDRLSGKRMIVELLVFLGVLAGVAVLAIESKPEDKNPVHPKPNLYANIPAPKTGYPGSAA